MKILCDVHISYKICRFFEVNGISATHVNTILEKWNTPDNDISRFADLNEMVVLTKDSDFQNSHFLKKQPRKLLKISLGNLSNQQLISILELNLPILISNFEKETCFVEIGQDFIRVIS